MKATGIVRRIDYRVIIGTKVRSLENTGVFADFCPISSIPQAVMKLPSQQPFKLRKEEQQLNIITQKAFIDF